MRNRDIGAGIQLSVIAEQVGLTIKGRTDLLIRGITPFDFGEADCIAFSSELNVRRLKPILESSPLAALIVHKKIDLEQLPAGISYLHSEDPLRSLIDVVPLFYQPDDRIEGVSRLASVHSSVLLGRNVSIGDFVSIAAGCIIGDDVTIYPQTVLYPEVTIGSGSTVHAGAIIRERCQIGEHTIIQNGAIIGADGFGYIPDAKEGVRAVPQVGIVALADRVEIGANSCVDRGAFGNTTIGVASKVDNLAQIGHNVRIGQYSFICGQAAIAGSAILGNHVTIGGNTGISGHLEIHDHIRVAGNSGVINSLEESGDYGGFPAQPAALWRRQVASLRRLPETLARLRKDRTAADPEESNKE